MNLWFYEQKCFSEKKAGLFTHCGIPGLLVMWGAKAGGWLSSSLKDFFGFNRSFFSNPWMGCLLPHSPHHTLWALLAHRPHLRMCFSQRASAHSPPETHASFILWDATRHIWKGFFLIHKLKMMAVTCTFQRWLKYQHGKCWLLGHSPSFPFSLLVPRVLWRSAFSNPAFLNFLCCVHLAFSPGLMLLGCPPRLCSVRGRQGDSTSRLALCHLGPLQEISPKPG